MAPDEGRPRHRNGRHPRAGGWTRRLIRQTADPGTRIGAVLMGLVFLLLVVGIIHAIRTAGTPAASSPGTITSYNPAWAGGGIRTAPDTGGEGGGDGGAR